MASAVSTTQRLGFDPTHIHLFFLHNKPKTLSERGAQAPVDVVDVGALSESEFGACLHCLGHAELLGVK